MRAAVAGGLGAVLLVVGLPPRSAVACSYFIPPPHEISQSQVGVDITPPVLSEVVLSKLQRGIPAGGTCSTSATISLGADASDDMTPREGLGYRVEALRGNPPPIPYDEPMSDMVFTWEEDPTEPLDFELRIRAVDAAGNESNPLDVRIADGVEAEGSEGGCNLERAGSATPLAWLPMLAAMAWAFRRRREPTSSGVRC